MRDSLVSVICVTMNHAKYVQQSFSTIINQTYKNIEILYIDNSSSDDTFEIADKLFKDSGISYEGFKRERSYNLPENLNFLLKKAKGDYCFLISGDDWTLETCIEGMLNYYEKNTHYGLVYGNGWYYYDDSQKLVPAETKKFISGHIFDHIFLYSVPFPVGIMVKQETFKKVGLFDESILIEDYDFWLRVAKDYEIGYFNIPSIIYRKHSESMTGILGNTYIPEYLKIVEKYKDNKYYERVKREFRKFTIYENFKNKKWAKATTLILKDFRFERFYLSVLFKMFFHIPVKKVPQVHL